MRILIRVAPADTRAWLLPFALQLEKEGNQVGFQSVPMESGTRHGQVIERVLSIQSAIFGAGSFQRIDPASLPRLDHEADAFLDFSPAPPSSRALALHLDDHAGMAGLLPALTAGHVPLVSFRHADGSIAAHGLPAIEQTDILPRAADDFTRRLVTLARIALNSGVATTNMRPSEKRAGAPNAWRYLFGGLARKVAQKATGGRSRAEHWRVGIRAASHPPGYDREQGLEGFRWLEDDGGRYYADPILWTENGRQFLFVEEFPYATKRGIISFTELDTGGVPLFTPRPLIERKGHLSYPFLFRHRGAIYMSPENAAENHLPLYRARRFPDLWDEMPPLVADVGLHDATLLEHAGRWWLIGNIAADNGSSWDCLAIFHAGNPLGPFTPMVGNPVIVDSRYARSAGPVLVQDGCLIRPVQNCLGGYGRFLRMMMIDHLDLDGFSQRQIGRIAPPLNGQVKGVHTYARSERFEAIDILTPRAWKAPIG